LARGWATSLVPQVGVPRSDANPSTSSGQALGRGRFGPAHRTSPTHDLRHEYNLHPVRAPSSV